MAVPQMPISSPGTAIGNRQRLESTIGAYLDEVMPDFFAEVQALAEQGAELTPAQVEAIWLQYTYKVETMLSDAQLAWFGLLGGGVAGYLAAGSIAADAYNTARAVQLTGATGATLRAYLQDAFRPDAQILGEGAVYAPPAGLRPASRPPTAAPGVDPSKALDGKTTWQNATFRQARDAATATYNEAVISQMRAQGMRYKAWITRRDDKVRETHAHADAQVRPVGERFAVGADLLMYPHDPQGTPGETHGCRCVVVAVNPPVTIENG